MVTVSKFDKSKPVYYQWLHQPLYNKTQDTNCWYQLTSRPALNRTKPVNLLQRHKNTWEPVKYQSHFVLLLVIFYCFFFTKNQCGCLCLQTRTNEICLENCFIAIGCTCLHNMQIFLWWDNDCENYTCVLPWFTDCLKKIGKTIYTSTITHQWLNRDKSIIFPLRSSTLSLAQSRCSFCVVWGGVWGLIFKVWRSSNQLGEIG